MGYELFAILTRNLGGNSGEIVHHRFLEIMKGLMLKKLYNKLLGSFNRGFHNSLINTARFFTFI